MLGHRIGTSGRTPLASRRFPVAARASSSQDGSGRLVAPYNVLITGSTKGVGLALAEQHLKDGDNVVICSRTEEAVRTVMRDLKDRYGSDRVSGQACNVCKGSDVASLIERAQSELGSIDLWINNAGTNMYSFKSLMETAESDLASIVDTNMLGVLICCREAMNAMRKQPQGGHIFNMDGAGSDGNPTPRFAAYGATKRSVSQLAKSLEAEMSQAGITNVGIHSLSPGMVTTELLMSGADTPQSKFFINCLADSPDTVAAEIVPQIRRVPARVSLGGRAPSGTYIKYLTSPKAYSRIAMRLLTGQSKSRFVPEE